MLIYPDIYIYVCMHVYIYIIHMHTYIYMYVYKYACMDGRMDGWIHLQSSYRVYMYAIFDCLFKACLISYYYIFQLHAYMPTGMHACIL